ncbi:MAG: methyltransferase [Terracidiphilus sp.]
MKIPIPALVVPVVCLLLYLFVPGLRRRPWTALRVAGAIVAIAGYFLFVTARIQLGRSFSVSPQAKELITHGLYSRIRNPIYVGVGVMWLGLIVSLHLYWLFLHVWTVCVKQTEVRGSCIFPLRVRSMYA